MSEQHEMQFIDQSKPLWRCIYIAKDHSGDLLGLILAPSYAIAQAYFVGTGLTPHEIEVIDPCNSKGGDPVSGICIIAKAVQASPGRYESSVTKLTR